MIKNKLPFVSVAIVSYNGKKNLEYSLPSLINQTYENYKIYVLDNNSNDGTDVWLEKNFPDVVLIKQHDNIGMGALNLILNPEFNKDECDYVFVAGWDTIFHSTSIQDAVEVLESDLTIGGIGFRVFGLLEPVPLQEFQDECLHYSSVTIKETNWIPGACGMYRRVLIDKIGFIDETYFAYSEEDDFQFRITRSGFKLVEISTPCWFNVDVASIPKKHASYLYFRNFIRFNIKNNGFKRAFRITISLMKIACTPFYYINLNTRVNQRKRPFSIYQNFIILSRAIFWNILNLKQTLESSKISKIQIHNGQKLFQLFKSK